MNQKTPLKDYAFVTVQVLLFIIYFLPLLVFNFQLPEWLCYSGLILMGVAILFGIIALLQLNTRLSPFPSPVTSGKLITSGAYRISRHPIYLALLFSALGYAIYGSSLYKVLITLFLFILFYYKSVYEESLLEKRYPEYQDYQKKTRRFI